MGVAVVISKAVQEGKMTCNRVNVELFFFFNFGKGDGEIGGGEIQASEDRSSRKKWEAEEVGR